jgi:hypothetical protein
VVTGLPEGIKKLARASDMSLADMTAVLETADTLEM